MMIKSYNYTELVLRNPKTGRIDPTQMMLLASSGGGKSIATESFVYKMWKAGFVIIVLTDVKDEMEFAFASFKPRERYHLEELDNFEIEPEAIPVKIYHPFTFKFPFNRKLPEINLFTFDIRKLGTEELSMLAETNYETDSMRLMKDSISHLNKSESIYDFLYDIRGKIKRIKKRHFGKEIMTPDSNNFWMDVGTKSTKSNLGEITDFFKPFLENYMVADSECELNLNIKQMINDQEHYHVLSTKFLPNNRKIKDWVVFTMLNQINRTISDNAKHPICLVIEEVNYLCPRYVQGYKEFSADTIRDILLTIRNKGKGVSSIMNGQSYKEINEKVINSTTDLLIGRIGSMKDREAIAKSMNFPRFIMETIDSMKIGNFLVKGFEDNGAIKIIMPPHCHKETFYNFFEMYEQEYPEKLKKYSKEHDYMLERRKLHEEKIKNRMMKEQEQQKKDAEEDFAQKQKLEKKDEEIASLKDEKKVRKQTETKSKESEILQMHKQGKSYSQIAEEFNTTKQNIYRIIKKIKSKDETEELLEEMQEPSNYDDVIE